MRNYCSNPHTGLESPGFSHGEDVNLLFFGGFIVIGNEWFQMWRSTQWNGASAAFRAAVLAILTLMFVQFGSVFPNAAAPSDRGPGTR